MRTMDANDARTFHMRELVAKAGGPAEWARRFGGTQWQQPQVSQWISEANPKGIGKNLARSLEAAQGLRSGSLDVIPGHANTPSGRDVEPTLEKHVEELQNKVDSLVVLLANVIGVSALHRPIEGDALAQRIRGMGSLDPVRHQLVADMLSVLDQRGQGLAKPAARARK